MDIVNNRLLEIRNNLGGINQEIHYISKPEDRQRGSLYGWRVIVRACYSNKLDQKATEHARVFNIMERTDVFTIRDGRIVLERIQQMEFQSVISDRPVICKSEDGHK